MSGTGQSFPEAIVALMLRLREFGIAAPELLKMVEHLSDKDIMALNRGGHDPYKVYAAYAQAVKSNGKPTVILAKTIKGYAFGGGAEAQNATHSVKKQLLGVRLLRVDGPGWSGGDETTEISVNKTSWHRQPWATGRCSSHCDA